MTASSTGRAGAADVLRRAGALLQPRRRLLPSLGVRLSPRLLVSILAVLRRLPGERVRFAVRRNVSYPLLERVGTIVVPVRGGFRLRVPASEAFGRVLATTGVWEPHVTAAFARLLRPGDVCVDVGAHHGYYSLLASRLVGPTGHVHAVEPAAAAYAALLANIRLNGATNVTASAVAAGAAAERRLLERAQDGGSLRMRLADGEAEASATAAVVEVQPLAAIVEPEHLARVRLIKIDVEGHEAGVLAGVEAIFDAGGRPSVLVEIHRGDGGAAAAVLARLVDRFSLRAYELVEGTVDARPADLGGLDGECHVLLTG